MITNRSPFALRVPELTELPVEEPRGGRDSENARAVAAAEAQARRDAEDAAARQADELRVQRRITRQDLRRLEELAQRTQLVRAGTTVARGDALLSFVLWLAIGAAATYWAARFSA